MDTQPQNGPACQSCGMPMVASGDYGSETDGSKNEDYCRYCYDEGSFTEPYITLEEMINKCAGIMAVTMKIKEDEARAMLKSVLPVLKRWRNK